MPEYKYRCPQCDKQHTVFQPMDAPHPTCGKCGSELVRVPVLGSFRVPGFNAANGYSKKAPAS